MIKVKTEKKCRECGTAFRIYKTTDKYCSLNCKIKAEINNSKGTESPTFKAIKRESDKTKKRMYEYYKLRKEFLSKPENRICFVDGCLNLADTVEHTKGRIGNNLLDVSTWQPCCLYHNLEFERNPELSKKYQLSRFHKGKKIEK